MLGFLFFSFLLVYTWFNFSPTHGFSSPIVHADIDLMNQTCPLPPSQHNATVMHHPFVAATLAHADAAYHALQGLRASVFKVMVRIFLFLLV